MKKLHLTPITVHLLKSSQRDIKDFAEVSLIQIEDNTLSFRSNMYYEMSHNRKAQHTLKKLGANFKKYNNKYSHKLHLYFNKNCGLNQAVCWELGSSIAVNFRDLREFTLSFFMCDDLTDEGLRYLLVPISRIITRVRKLTINICRCKQISNAGLKSIESLLLVHAKMLRKLSFNCSGEASRWSNQKIVPTEINIATRICNYANIRKVDPFYLASPISYQGILNLTKTISRYLKNLEQCTFIPLLNENQENICTIIFHLISRLRKLGVFCLGFYSYGCLLAEHIDNITRSIGKNLLNLEYLTLDFKDEIFAFEVTNQLLTQIASNIFSNLPLLRGFALGFNNYHTTVTSVGMASFVQEICQHAKCLEELVIDIKFVPGFLSSIMHLISKNLYSLKRFTFNDWGTKPSLFSVLSKPELPLQAKGQLASKLTCPNLKELNLYFNTFDQGPFLFSENLEKLTLSFSSCREMTDRYFELLVRYIFDVPLRNLQELTLIFNQASKISDNEIKVLSSQSLIHLTNLRSLRLKFSESSYITDAALKYLEVPIQESLKNLKTFDLTFQNCEMLSESGIKSLVSVITKNFLKLEKLRLDFFNKKGILSLEEISAAIDRIARELKKLRKLELDFSFGDDCGRFSYYNNTEAWLTERVRKQLEYISEVGVHCYLKK